MSQKGINSAALTQSNALLALNIWIVISQVRHDLSTYDPDYFIYLWPLTLHSILLTATLLIFTMSSIWKFLHAPRDPPHHLLHPVFSRITGGNGGGKIDLKDPARKLVDMPPFQAVFFLSSFRGAALSLILFPSSIWAILKWKWKFVKEHFCRWTMLIQLILHKSYLLGLQKIE